MDDRTTTTGSAPTRRVVTEAFAALGTIEVVVNNAGSGLFAAVEEPADEQVRAVIDANLLGSIHVIRSALPHLRRQGHGRILQISTAGGQTTYPNFGYYHAAKWGTEGFCETVAREIAPFGLAVTIVEPGATPTGFGEAIDTAPAMPEYRNTPSGQARQIVASGAFVRPNDLRKTVDAMIRLVDDGETPLRLPLGSDTFDDVRASLVARLTEHDAHRDVALSVVTDRAG